MNSENIVQKLWSLCNILRGDGISYHEYISELTYLLFLKIAEETGTEDLLPVGCRWKDLVSFNGENLLFHYQEMLTHLGGAGATETVREIYAFPTTVFNHTENLKAVIDGINKIDWHSVSDDSFGQIFHLDKDEIARKRGANVIDIFKDIKAADTMFKIWQQSGAATGSALYKRFDDAIAKLKSEIKDTKPFAKARQCAVLLSKAEYPWIGEYVI
jgi:type I restriction enzyme M protein